MLRIIIAIVFIVSFQFGFTQNAALGLDEYIKYAHADNNGEKPVLYEYVQGSCYLNDTFIDGQITLDIGKTFQGPIRYDIYADQIEFKNSANEIFIVQNPKAIRMVYMDSLKFNYFEPGLFKDVKGFYEILLIGDYSLYKKYQIFLKNPEAAGPGFQTSVAIFIPQDSKYFIMDPDTYAQGAVLLWEKREDFDAYLKSEEFKTTVLDICQGEPRIEVYIHTPNLTDGVLI